MIRYLVTIICLTKSFILIAKEDSLITKFNLNLYSSTNHFLPHYQVFNNYAFNSLRNQHILGLDLKYRKSFNVFEVELGFLPSYSNRSKFEFQEYYLSSIFFKTIEVSIGAKRSTLGLHDTELSTGSLSLSNNARPIPKIYLGIREFWSVPLTNGYLKLKGNIAHGWFEENRNINFPYLHEKSLHFKIGGDFPVNFSGGIVHHAIWSGSFQGKELPSSFKDYVKVFFVQPADDDIDEFGGEALNVLGNHLGTIDGQIEIRFNNSKFTIYHQTPFEDNTGTKLFWKRNNDRLLGLHFQNKNKSFNVLYEYVHTKQQTNPGLNFFIDTLSNYGYGYGGRDNYYNNYIYTSGWTYKNFILGTPLFTTVDRIRKFEPSFIDPDQDFKFKIINNRIVAHHLGFSGVLRKNINFRVLTTYTVNFGTYGGINGGYNRWGSRDPNYNFDYYFDPPRKQWYFLLETSFYVPKWENLNFTTSLAVDRGEMTDNLGLMLGIEYQPVINFKANGRGKKKTEK